MIDFKWLIVIIHFGGGIKVSLATYFHFLCLRVGETISSLFMLDVIQIVKAQIGGMGTPTFQLYIKDTMLIRLIVSFINPKEHWQFSNNKRRKVDLKS